ncbi:hypothetical protein CHUAL_007565 [Chamberlinius hualienensis]
MLLSFAHIFFFLSTTSLLNFKATTLLRQLISKPKMETFGFLVAVFVALIGLTTGRPPICEKPPPWALSGVDHMETHAGNVTVVVLLKAS